jgi:hypothetical protein
MNSELLVILSWVGITVIGVAFESRAQEKATKHSIEVKVLVLNYDPLVPKAGGGTERLHEALKWNDPRKLVEEYVADLDKATAGSVSLKISDWRDLDQFPPKKDGFKYSTEAYSSATTQVEAGTNAMGWTTLGGGGKQVDELVGNGTVDEVAVCGPYFDTGSRQWPSPFVLHQRRSFA